MPLNPELLEMLVCPVCHTKLVAQQDQLDCSACQLSFPVREGIPVLLVEEAVKQGEANGE